MLQTSFVDDITDDQRLWLQQLKAAADRSVNMSLPEWIFQAFKARSWLEGEPLACKLNPEGVYAALRLLVPAEKDKKKARRKR